MIAGLSKAVTLYLAPLLGLTTIFLTLFALLAPNLLLQDQVALLTVIPSTALQSQSLLSIDGPSVFMGILGFCARSSNSAPINCTIPNVSPQYDLSVLPGNAPILLLSAPTGSPAAFVSVAVAFSIIFFVTFTMISLRHKLPGKLNTALEKPMLQRLSAWIGFFSFMIGVTTFLIIRMWFGKAVQDFNASIVAQGQQGPKLIASIGNAFTMVWVGYAFFAVPVITSLAKLNVMATKQ